MNKNNILKRVRSRFKKHSVSDHLAGLWISRKFTKNGILLATGGLPFPGVINHGGDLIAKNCQFYSGVRFEIGEDAVIRIGNGTYINRNTLLVADQLIEIGKNCKISWDVVIMDTDMHALTPHACIHKPVIIDDNVWIGCRAVILKGVHVGKNAVVAAGAVVTKDVPAFSIFGGNPAKLIGMVQPVQPRLPVSGL